MVTAQQGIDQRGHTVLLSGKARRSMASTCDHRLSVFRFEEECNAAQTRRLSLPRGGTRNSKIDNTHFARFRHQYVAGMNIAVQYAALMNLRIGFDDGGADRGEGTRGIGAFLLPQFPRARLCVISIEPLGKQIRTAVGQVIHPHTGGRGSASNMTQNAGLSGQRLIHGTDRASSRDLQRRQMARRSPHLVDLRIHQCLNRPLHNIAANGIAGHKRRLNLF